MDLDSIYFDSIAPLLNSAELQLIYKTAPIGLAFLGLDCRYVMINEHLTEICGISIANHIGRSVRETVPQVADQVEHIVATILQNGEPITGVEVHGQQPDGSNRDRVWMTYWHPFRDRNGRIVGINVAAEEISERKRAESALVASQERLSRLNAELEERVEAQAQERNRVWNVSQDLLVVSDTVGNIININPAWHTTLGWSADELIGKGGEWLIHPNDRQRSHAALADLIAGRTTKHFENRLRCKDSSYRWVSWFAIEDRGLLYASGRDISSLKKAQEQLHRLRRELADASHRTSMDEMTATIAHEIKQPLAAILTSANAGSRWLSRAKPNLAEARSALEQIVRAGVHITDMIDSIRSMFGPSHVQARLVDVRVLINEVLALCQSELETHGITLRNEMGDDVPQVMGAHVQLQQVILNLISNAVEAMIATKERDRFLTITSRRDAEETLVIAFEDTGPGIDPAHLGRVFDAFFTTKPRGMGLGLSICRSIVEAHGGTLLASSKKPFGAAFHLSLPIPGGSASPKTALIASSLNREAGTIEPKADGERDSTHEKT